MQLHAGLAQLEHAPQHGKAPARLSGQQIEGRQHRLGGGVVGLIKHGEAPLLQPAVAATRHGNGQLLQLAEPNPQMACHRDRQQQVAGVVASLQRQLQGAAVHLQRGPLIIPVPQQIG